MSKDGPKKIYSAAPLVPFDERATSHWPRIRKGVRPGPITRSNVSDVTASQTLPPFPTDRSEQPSGTSFTQQNIGWDDLIGSNAHADINDNLRAFIAGTQSAYSQDEWYQLHPLDRSFLVALRQSSAVGLKRLAGEYLDEDNPLLPDVVNAARSLFEQGMLQNCRADRMLAAEIMISASPFLPIGSGPAYDAASALRQFIEAQANRSKGMDEFVIQETAFSQIARTKPRPPMITKKLMRIMRKGAMHRAEESVAAEASEALTCMQAYEGFIPRFKRGHTEVMAGMLMCGTLIEATSNNELIGKAYEIQGQLTDLQLASSTPLPNMPKTRPL